LKKEQLEEKVFVLDIPKPKQTLSNTQIYRELVNAADPFNDRYTTPQVHMIQGTGWKTASPWLWYAALVAGVWISENTLSAASGIAVSSVAGPMSPMLLLLAFVCAGYPMTRVQAAQLVQWRIMTLAATSLGQGENAYFFWCVLGASALVYYIVVHARVLQRILISHPLLTLLGRMSFAQYLTHIPILYTLASLLLVKLYPFFDINLNVASLVALALSLPAMLGVAYLFWVLVDEPAIRLSREIGYRLLGLSESNLSREYNTKEVIETSSTSGRPTEKMKESNTINQYYEEENLQVGA
jgi:peptidoglycan/LPS O-acetylase OafA/YrhL